MAGLQSCARGLTLPSSGPAFGRPLKSNVRRHQYMSSTTFFAAFFLSFAMLGSGHAMSCAPSEPVTAIVSASDHIFVAQIRTSTLAVDKQMVDATFTVEEVLKGNPNQVTAIQSRFSDYNYRTDGSQVSGGNSDLSPGMHLLVFAKGIGPVLYGPCAYSTRLLRHDDNFLQATRSITGQR